jgi:hypothetical protein
MIVVTATSIIKNSVNLRLRLSGLFSRSEECCKVVEYVLHCSYYTATVKQRQLHPKLSYIAEVYYKGLVALS